MKSIEWLPNYSADHYTGPAMRVGAGVSLEEFYHAAEDHDVTAVGGECSVSLSITTFPYALINP